MDADDEKFFKDYLKISNNLKKSQGGEGNNQTSPPAKNYRSRRYIFVINNYTEEIFEKAKKYLSSKSQYYIVGREVGESGTPHLQGYCEFKHQVFANTIYDKITKKMFLTKAKGNKNQNFIYCSKDGNYISNYDNITFQERLKEKILEEEFKDVKWKPFQQEIINLINTTPDKRKIHWYYEPDGNVGKSYLFKYLNIIRSDVIICDGKKDNILYSIQKMLESEIEPRIIVLDIPRTNKDFVNYSLIEQIKNGCVQSGKYEGAKCLFRIPHIIISSNGEPDYNAWSQDRYDVKLIDNNQEE